jgi:hypothetical protein
LIKRDGQEDLESFRTSFSTPLDREIGYAVWVLQSAGVETYESCGGGAGHAFTEPTIRFFGGPEEGLRAVSIALKHQLPVFTLRSFWTIQNGELTGPGWEVTFFPLERLMQVQEQAENSDSQLSSKSPTPQDLGGRGRETTTCLRR